MDINMHKAFNYRHYPTKSQRSMMNRTLGLCRWTYNQTLAYRKNAYEKEGRSVSKYANHNLLPAWKVDKPELNEVFSQTLQNVQERVDWLSRLFSGELSRAGSRDIPVSEVKDGMIHSHILRWDSNSKMNKSTSLRSEISRSSSTDP